MSTPKKPTKLKMTLETDDGEVITLLDATAQDAINNQPEFAADFERAIGRVVLQWSQVEWFLEVAINSTKTRRPELQETQHPISIKAKIAWIKKAHTGKSMREVISEFASHVKRFAHTRNDVIHGAFQKYIDDDPPRISLVRFDEGKPKIAEHTLDEIEKTAQALIDATGCAAAVMYACAWQQLTDEALAEPHLPLKDHH